MLRIVLYVVLGLAGLGVIGLIAGYVQAQRVPAPDNVNNGTLAPCPDAPNCVSSLATDTEHGMEPIPYTGTQAEAQAKLMTIINDLPRATVITEQPGYVYVETRSPTMGFPDDVEFVFDDDNKQIQFRSAARMGRDDLNKNRERMEAIRTAFLAA